jgi:hypothetical protein
VRTWKVTVRHGSSVDRKKFDSLDDAIGDAQQSVEEIQRGDRLPPARMVRDFSPAELVHARIELSGPGLLRGPEGGIDVMGDGSAIAYTGAIRKRQIDADSLDHAFERLRDALAT